MSNISSTQRCTDFLVGDVEDANNEVNNHDPT